MEYTYLQFSQDAHLLYAHFTNLRDRETPSQLVQRFRSLFIDGIDYPDPTVLTVLYRMIHSQWADRELGFVLNRCCYILINYWWLQSYWWLDSTFRQATVELVALLQTPPASAAASWTIQRLRGLVRQFAATEQFRLLQRRAWLIEHPPEDAQQTIGSLIYRYPFLYPHYLLDWDSSEMGHQVIHKLQKEREKQFDQALFRYTNHLLRQTARSHPATIPEDVPNPTLFSNHQLRTTIKTYAGKQNGRDTYRDLAKRFVETGMQARSYREMKIQLYGYLTDSIAPDYGKHSFNRWLEQKLQETLPQREQLIPSQFLLVQTCRHLLDALIVNPYHHLEEHVRIFVDLVNNLQARETIGLLLKIALICTIPGHSVKSYLSQRFSAIFRYYEKRLQGEIGWLVECLEHLMVALSLHFGHSNFSWATLL